ncbi:mannan polymerase II complex Anp1p subunit [Trichomonascus vanleenenianus]|uniref:ANP1/MMN9/VAN1 family protein n=1 Tax=Trichomonascus vanleenenianus TaxID=2268995 RepID=UPI003ECAB487
MSISYRAKEELPKYEFKPRSTRSRAPRGKIARNVVLAIIFILIVLRIVDSPELYRSQAAQEKAIAETVSYYDLGSYRGNSDGSAKEDQLLMLIPLKDAAPNIPLMFDHLRNLTYPHRLIDIAFMVSDSTDNTLELLKAHLHEIQRVGTTEGEERVFSQYRFNHIEIFEKDFGQIIGQGFDDRHGVKVQGVRRKLMGKARNWLLTAALKPYHSWVYWRDADIETAPATIIEDLMKHDKDVIVPNVWRPLPEWLGGEQPYDLNSWQESPAALELAKTLDEDEVIVEGYAEYPTWRPHLAYFREKDGDPDLMIDLDGVGGVSILARARTFRQGANFPAFAFENHAETEAFGKMCRKMGFSVSGLVHYTVWHKYEPSEDDLKKMREMELEERRKQVDEIAANENLETVSFVPS